MSITRRGFLCAILAAGVAPYVMSGGVASGILMPVRKVVLLDRGVITLYDASGRVLSDINCPTGRFDNTTCGAVTATGTFAYARIKSPWFNDQILDLTMDHDSLIAGSLVHVSPLEFQRAE